ncbi:MAG: methane monooxygenase/ammonia monooxygenase subunit B [Nevskiales bacterium]|nr:methane monooxygenase/ammonia monooxygenase subunit B [Nevskiales bacterium]
MKRLISLTCSALVAMLSLVAAMEPAQAHGERAQMPQLRMRSVHWFDINVSTVNMQINDLIKVTGSFMPSNYWPEHVQSIEKTAFLNIGVPGPSFVRLDSRVNGVPMIRSTAFKKGELYNFEITLKARKTGRYHVHPVINVEGTGPIIGPGLWVEVGGDEAAFENSATTLLGKTINLESYGLANAAFWSGLWFVIGLAWFAYWLLKCPIVVPRFKRVNELGPAEADKIITPNDRRAGLVFLVLALSVVAGSYMYTQEKWPITTPLQTGKIEVPPIDVDLPLQVRLQDARYRIPGRSFRMELEVTNSGDSPVMVGEFAAGNLRFINSDVLKVTPKDEDDLVATDALRVEGGPIAPGETRTIVVYADDALWETQRMTTMIASPDALVAGMLFFFDANGERFPVEVGGMMIPEFV